MAIIKTLKVVGTTYEARQSRIAEMEELAPVTFKLEPGNTYDPKAIAIVNEAGEHLGYVGRDDEQREVIRLALRNGFVVARAQKVGGFKKYDGSRASYGLRVQWYPVSAMYGFADNHKDENEETIQRKRKNSAQAPKRKGNEWKDQVKRHHKGRYTWQEIEAIKERRAG